MINNSIQFKKLGIDSHFNRSLTKHAIIFQHLLFARFLNCENPNEELLSPCNECESCKAAMLVKERQA